MKKEEVPQHQSRTYAGHRKVIYAVNPQGGYEQLPSSGWEAEEFATLMAVEELQRQTLDAYRRAEQGTGSPLEYYMFLKRMDITGLAQATGFFKWQVKRHLKPGGLARLAQHKLQRYQDALGIAREDLLTLPPEAPRYDD